MGHERLHGSTTNGQSKAGVLYMFTLESIAKLADRRELPNFLERHYPGKPVAEAIAFVHEKEQRKWGKILLEMLVAFVALFAPLAFVAPPIQSLDLPVWARILCLLDVVILLGATVFAGMLLVALFTVPYPRIVAAEKFLEDLNAFLKQCPTPLELSHEEGLKAQANGILLNLAREVLKLRPSGEYDVSYEVEKARLMANMRDRHDSYQRLGLVSGGYDKYFAKAKKELEELEKNPPALVEGAAPVSVG